MEIYLGKEENRIEVFSSISQNYFQPVGKEWA
jgi:hypothetical protein